MRLFTLLAVVVVVASGCGPALESSVCGPETCRGCCSDGVCFLGQATDACGAGGAACQACGTGSVCAQNQCRLGGIDAGNPAADAGATLEGADSGSEADAGVRDAGLRDAGIVLRDAGPSHDAGVSPHDAGAPSTDGGRTDGGLPRIDAGISATDAAVRDAGPNPFDALYAPSFALTPLDTAAIGAVAKPTSKATDLATPSYIDPAYGTRVYKATDPSDYPGSGQVRHDYSRRQAFNADNTRYLAMAGNGYWLLYDANTFTVLARSGTQGALKGLAGDAEAIWHPTDPKTLWYNAGLVWYQKNVETDVDTVMVNFAGRLPWSGATQVWTKAEGTSSADGRYWGFMATSYDSSTQTNTIHGLLTYDRVTDTIVGTLSASAFGNVFPDHISMSPSGKYVVPSWAYTPALGTRAYPLDFSSSIQLCVNSEHSDLAFGPNGEDYYVVSDYGPSDQGGDWLRAVDLATGNSFHLMTLYPHAGSGYAAHISGKAFGRPGWVLVGTYADTANYGAVAPDPVLAPMYRKFMLVELKPGGRILNVAHTRAAAGYGGYWGEHQATISRDGSRIIFASNFDSGTVSSYVIGLPSWVWP